MVQNKKRQGQELKKFQFSCKKSHSQITVTTVAADLLEGKRNRKTDPQNATCRGFKMQLTWTGPCIRVAGSLCCPPEATPALLTGYSSIKWKAWNEIHLTWDYWETYKLRPRIYIIIYPPFQQLKKTTDTLTRLAAYPLESDPNVPVSTRGLPLKKIIIIIIYFYSLTTVQPRGLLVPWPRTEPWPLPWKHGVLTPGLPGKAQLILND